MKDSNNHLTTATSHIQSKIIGGSVVLLIPLVLWITLMQLAGLFPLDSRPRINVDLLPQMENLIFGTVLIYKSLPQYDALIICAAIPYLLHFSIPFMVTFFLWWFRKDFLMFLWYFGMLNLFGVCAQLIFPTAPPWYTDQYGYSTASYKLSGNPGYLARVDELLGIGLFSHLYGASPIVFGSYPSLHAAWPFLVFVYQLHYHTEIRFPLPWMVFCYSLWVWWAAVYTRHHFVVDVIGGLVFVSGSFVMATLMLKGMKWLKKYIIHRTHLPSPKTHGWVQPRHDVRLFSYER